MSVDERALRLRLHGESVGLLVEQGAGERVTYDLHFEQEWISRSPRPVLSLGMLNWRLQTPRRFKGRLPPFLTNLLPERHGALRRRIARAAQLDEHDDVALLGFVGRSLSGALTAEPVRAASPDVRVIEVPMVPGGAGERLRWSLGGMQLKFSVDRADRVTLPVDGRDGRWILKIPEVNRPTLPRAELAAMEWARLVGFDVPDLEIIDPRQVEGLPEDAFDGISEALLVRRFDRLEDHTPVHMEELASVLQVHPEEKYSEPHDPHPAYHLVSVGRIIARFAGHDALLTFLARVIFDVLVGNGDAHLKNWSFLYHDGRSPSLAPVYDVVPTILFGVPPTLALRFAGGVAFRAVDLARVRQFAVKVGADPDELVRVAQETVARATATFAEAMSLAGLSSAEVAALRAHWEGLPIVRGG